MLLNNAGIFQPKPFLEQTEADIERYLNLLRGYFFMSQAAIAQMQQRGGGDRQYWVNAVKSRDRGNSL